MQPLVRAAVPAAPGLQPGTTTTAFQPGMTTGFQPAGTWQPGPGSAVGMVPTNQTARSTELLRTGIWLVVSLAGTGLGIALSSSLITMLR